MATDFTLGIDLGTTNSVAAVWLRGRPCVLPIQNRGPRELLRSVVLIESPDTVHVGEAALNRRALMPDRFIASVKSRMGTDHVYHVGGQEYTPEQVASFILKEVIHRAGLALQRELGGQAVAFRNLVITVPARFSPNARLATERAAALAGYPPGERRTPHTHELRLESDAAALSYFRNDPHPRTVLVYDLGGGTFDVSVMRYQGPVSDGPPFRHLGPPGGDPRLGGDVFDQRLFERMMEHFNAAGGSGSAQRGYPACVDLTQPAPSGVAPAEWMGAQQRLLEAARLFKEQVCDPGLDDDDPHSVILPELLGRSQPEPFVLTRAAFQTLIADQVERTGAEVLRLLNEFGVDRREIDRVVLAGGSTRIPAVKTLLKRIFGFAPDDRFEADKAVALGAALYGELRELHEIEPLPLFLTVPIGIKVTRQVKESIIGGIGRETEQGGLFQEVLPRGTRCPGDGMLTVTTVQDQQKRLRFEIYQQDGGDGACQPSDLMAWFDLALPERARGPRGAPRVAITFTLNPSGTQVDVAAVEQQTGLAVTRQLWLKQRDAPPLSPAGQADIVVAMDTTGSMGPYIDDMRRLTGQFAAKLCASGVDYRLALIDYGDLKLNEPLNVHPFTSDVADFRGHLDDLRAAGGGDEPESSLDAIEQALDLAYRDTAQRVVILITDASAHDPSTRGTPLPALARRLQEERTALYVVSAPKQHEQYGELITLGRFYEMGRCFDDILDDVAQEICDVAVS